MTEAEFESIVKKAFKIFQNFAPNKNTRYVKYYKNTYGNWAKGSTGNLAFNALRTKYKPTKTKFRAEIYVDDKIAPYVYYTNERWLSQRWKGHKNPNEGWVLRGANKIALMVANKTNGTKGKWLKETKNDRFNNAK